MKNGEYRPRGMLMIIDTGLAQFDDHCDGISTGNVWGGSQHSSCIRPFNETECNGYEWEPGHLQATDLEYWTRQRTPRGMLDFVRQQAQTQPVILYEFRHWYWVNHKWEKTVDGWVVTRGHDHNCELLRKFYADGDLRHQRVVDVCAEYVSNPPRGA